MTTFARYLAINYSGTTSGKSPRVCLMRGNAPHKVLAPTTGHKEAV